MAHCPTTTLHAQRTSDDDCHQQLHRQDTVDKRRHEANGNGEFLESLAECQVHGDLGIANGEALENQNELVDDARD